MTMIMDIVGMSGHMMHWHCLLESGPGLMIKDYKSYSTLVGASW